MQKERLKTEKAKKFAEKIAKVANSTGTVVTSKMKEKKWKRDVPSDPPLPPYVEETIIGHKKGLETLSQ